MEGWAEGVEGALLAGPPTEAVACRGATRLVSVLLKGALATGYANRLWTTARVAEVISKNFRVRYTAITWAGSCTLWDGATRSRRSKRLSATRLTLAASSGRTGRG